MSNEIQIVKCPNLMVFSNNQVDNYPLTLSLSKGDISILLMVRQAHHERLINTLFLLFDSDKIQHRRLSAIDCCQSSL